MTLTIIVGVGALVAGFFGGMLFTLTNTAEVQRTVDHIEDQIREIFTKSDKG